MQVEQGTDKYVSGKKFRGHAWSKKGTKKSRRAARQIARQQRFYAVAVGWRPGIFRDWESANKQVMEYGGAVHQSFATLQEAYAFMAAHMHYPPGVCTPFPPCPNTPLPPDEYVYHPAHSSDEETDDSDAPTAPPIQTPRRFRGHAWSKKGTKKSRSAARQKTHGQPPKAPGFYAVAKGIKCGIYRDWATASLQVVGVSGARFKRFDTLSQALMFLSAFNHNVHSA